MAFVVEDGTGKSDANSYSTVADFRAYCADRAIDVTADTDEAIQGNLVDGTDYVDLSYTFIGEATTDTQNLQFPRTKDEEDYGVPAKVIAATIEMALNARSGIDLFSDTDKNVTSKREKVGVIETELDYSDSKSTSSNTSRFSKVGKYLKDWIDYYADNAGQLRVISG